MLSFLFKPPGANRSLVPKKRSRLAQTFLSTITLVISLNAAPAWAQSEAMQLGEAFLTRFSGLQDFGSGPVLNTDGVVGSIFDVSQPSAKAMGQKLNDIFARKDIFASDVGQIFGVAINPENSDVYLSASSAYGLFRNADNSDWMDGMWGPDASPGTIWKLSAATDYVPEIFATITLDGRNNSGASLGNLAIDRQNNQLFVSDLETGYIHRLSLEDGTDLGRYDHGQIGRSSFVDKTEEALSGLDPVAFNPATSALVDGCPFGAFSETPSCWNFADFRRRVFGLAVRKDAETGGQRLYYSVWGSQGFGHPAWVAATASEKRNSVWSIGLAADGSLDATDIRRELLLPEFFSDPAEIAAKGPSHGAPDIAFPACKAPDTMLVSERAGIRANGLGGLTPPTFDNEARLLRFGLDVSRQWQLEGHHDIGFPKRANAPLDRANAIGGVAFGYGYTASGTLDTNQPDNFIWATGTRLCTEGAPCFDPLSGDFTDTSLVDGMQGFSASAPTGQFPDEASEAAVPANSYMIDADGDVSTSVLGQIGDVEILQRCEGGQEETVADWPIPEWWPNDPPDYPYDWNPDLQVTKTHSGITCRVGGVCGFTINVANVGDGDYSGPIFLEDVLPAGTVFDSAAAPWTCSVTGPAGVDCYHPPILLTSGDSVDLFLLLRIPPAMANQRQIRNCAAIRWMMTVPPNIIMYERALALAGYAVGPIDGVIDAMATAAITQFQHDHLLVPTGMINLEVHNALFGGDAGWGDINPANDQDCVTVPLDPRIPPTHRVDLSIQKRHVGNACLPGGQCRFFIRISNVGTLAYGNTVTFTDILPAGWTVSGITANLMTPWSCSPVGGNSIRCTHNPALLPPPTMAVGSSVALTLLANVPANEGRARVQNCASIDFNPAAPQDPGALGNDRSCATVNIIQRQIPHDLSHAFSLQASGTQSCTPPNCSSYQFTARLDKKNGAKRYDGPLKLNVALPPNSSFPTADVVQSGANCAPASWSCNRNGDTLQCSATQCQMEPGETIVLKLDGKVAPELTKPPATEQSRTLCGTLEWPKSNTARDCITTRILAKKPERTEVPPPLVRCPKGWVGKYQPNCRRPRCEDKGMIGQWPKCQPKRVLCPKGWVGKYQPNCRRPRCEDKGLVGQWPKCQPKRVRCPKGWVGKYQPNCRRPIIKVVPPKVTQPKVIKPRLIAPKQLQVIRCPRGQVQYKGRCISKIR